MQFHPVSNQHPRTLSRDDITRFNHDGFIAPINVFSTAEIAAHRTYFEQLMHRAAAVGWDSYSINGWQARCAGIYDLATHPRILDLVEDLLGPNLICWATHFFNKEAGDQRRVSWHQDAPYWPLRPNKTVTAWLAIDDADEENGAMRVVPGSHHHGAIVSRRSTRDERNVLYQTVDDIAQYGGQPKSLVLKAGQISLHADLLLHGSEPNPSTRRRCGLTLRYVPPEVRAQPGWSENSIIARGEDASGYWTPNPRPESDSIPHTGAAAQ